MSRYVLVPESLEHSVEVGWDVPLSTFFAIVKTHDTQEADESNLILWVGTKVEEIREVDTLAEIVKPYAHISDFVRHSLAEDFLTDPGPTMLQRQVREIFKGE